MKRAITILTCVLAAGMAAGQSPDVIRNTKALMDGVQSNATRQSNQALGITAAPAASKGAATVAKAPVASVPVKVSPVKTSLAKTSPSKPVVALKTSAAPKVAPVAVKHVAAKPVAKLVPAVATTGAKPAPAAPAAEPAKDPAKADGKWAMSGKRDPFVSPVVLQTGASNCASGKKCLEIGAINLRGVVHSENGFIAVVTNNLNKAYFLRENDPVFDGYVVKITGDSIIFQETVQDRVGKTFTKEVVKKLTTPSV
jgi:Tfp pilus assembly protein PilP